MPSFTECLDPIQWKGASPHWFLHRCIPFPKLDSNDKHFHCFARFPGKNKKQMKRSLPPETLPVWAKWLLGNLFWGAHGLWEPCYYCRSNILWGFAGSERSVWSSSDWRSFSPAGDNQVCTFRSWVSAPNQELFRQTKPNTGRFASRFAKKGCFAEFGVLFLEKPSGPKDWKKSRSPSGIEIFKRDWTFPASRPRNPYLLWGMWTSGIDNLQARLRLSSEIDYFFNLWALREARRIHTTRQTQITPTFVNFFVSSGLDVGCPLTGLQVLR